MSSSSVAPVIDCPPAPESSPRLTLRPTSRGKIVGKSPQLLEAMGTIDRVAKSSCTVLVTGESGTGKEVVVSALHEASTRSHGPLVVVNCGAIPEALLESELFGHAKGAFTGAHAAHKGRVAAAEGGTLFLDEIGELPLQLQSKLLRLLQQREYTPVGESRTMRCDVRIVAATNRDLEAEVEAGRFREDLYYRLNVIHVHLPALRERTDDVDLLIEHFLRVCKDRAGRDDIEGFTPDALAILRSYEWPGNIRELENAMERAVLLSLGTIITEQDLPGRIRAKAKSRVEATPAPAPSGAPALPESGIDLRDAVERFESALVRQALDRTGWNKNRAAQLLGINRTTLVEMVKRKKLA